MTNIKTLSLAFNKLTTLEVHFSKDLLSLSHLYLNDNPLIHIAADVFLKNPALSVIRSDWYMVCCKCHTGLSTNQTVCFLVFKFDLICSPDRSYRGAGNHCDYL